MRDCSLTPSRQVSSPHIKYMYYSQNFEMSPHPHTWVRPLGGGGGGGGAHEISKEWEKVLESEGESV
jgi:hypothetical protein